MKRSEERTEFLSDIVICFAEDFGYNGWRQILRYKHSEGPATCTFVDTEECPENHVKLKMSDPFVHAVDIEVVAKGLSLLRSSVVDMNSNMLANIKECDDVSDAGNIDAYDADAIVQAGLFKELIYG